MATPAGTAWVDPRPHPQAGLGRGLPDEAHDRHEIDERFAAPVHGDVGREPTFDLVPRARADAVIRRRAGEGVTERGAMALWRRIVLRLRCARGSFARAAVRRRRRHE